MTALIVAAFLALLGDPFIADATAEIDFVVGSPASTVRSHFHDIQVLRRNMPGVVAITDSSEGKWLYRTERSMPFSDVVKTDFLLIRLATTGVTFQTPDPEASNWMSFRLQTRALADDRTSVSVRLRVRLVREDGKAIHLFAPLLGETFINDRMEEDLEGMLATFASNLQQEIESSANQSATLSATQ